ncbi:hypothetical protein GF389_00785 [Candidatus Dojkabacteria bacterium]|nr:hypothetical protein [Candidatus Dojkabacteria bacterium]
MAIALSFLTSIGVLALVEVGLDADLQDTKKVEINFSSDADLDRVVEITREVGDYSRIEKTNSTQVVVEFVELDRNEEGLKEKFSEMENFSSITLTKINKATQDYSGVVVYLLFAVPIFVVFEYLMLDSIEKSRDKVGLIASFLAQNLIAAVIFSAILVSLSRLVPLTNEIFIIFGVLIAARVLLDIILLHKLNLAAKVNLQKDFPRFVENFVLKYDRNFVIVTLFSVVVFLPLVLVSTELFAAAILLTSFIALNILLETFVFSDLVSGYYYLIRKTPVVRKLKWSRK